MSVVGRLDGVSGLVQRCVPPSIWDGIKGFGVVQGAAGRQPSTATQPDKS